MSESPRRRTNKETARARNRNRQQRLCRQRREAGLPTVSVLSGPAGLAIGTVRRWAGERGRSVVEVGPDGATFQVQDTGPGIPLEDRERVFDPFHRLLGNHEFGSGLGLSIVKTIADRLGASISLGQSTGTGLQVIVTIPKNLICVSSSNQQFTATPSEM